MNISLCFLSDSWRVSILRNSLGLENCFSESCFREGHLLVVEADVPLADAVEAAGEGAGEVVVFGPDFLEVVLEGLQLL